MSKHTPGPWKATRSDPAEGYDVWWITANIVPHNGEKEITSVPGGASTSEGNARLIAAAPDLLAALRALVAKSTDLHGDWSEEWRKALEAIAKAEGRTALESVRETA